MPQRCNYTRDKAVMHPWMVFASLGLTKLAASEHPMTTPYTPAALLYPRVARTATWLPGETCPITLAQWEDRSKVVTALSTLGYARSQIQVTLFHPSRAGSVRGPYVYFNLLLTGSPLVKIRYVARTTLLSGKLCFGTSQEHG